MVANTRPIRQRRPSQHPRPPLGALLPPPHPPQAHHIRCMPRPRRQVLRLRNPPRRHLRSGGHWRRHWRPAHTFRPRARGRSLTAGGHLKGDPAGHAGHAGHAAAARWALEAWRSAAHDPDTLSIPQLASAVYLARPDACCATWRAAKGPIAVAHLELSRICWSWDPPPFEFTNQAHFISPPSRLPRPPFATFCTAPLCIASPSSSRAPIASSASLSNPS